LKDLINILVVGPRGLLPDLLIAALRQSAQFRIIARISSAEEITEILNKKHVDIALVGPMLSASSEQAHLLRRLRTELPGVKLIALLESRERGAVIEAFRRGVRGVLSLQHIEFDLFCRCLDCIDSGQIWASNEEIGWVLNEFEETPPGPATLNIVDSAGEKLLTSREEDVVLLVMDGLTNRDVASALSLSEHTVKNYLFHIFDKLGVSSRTELIAYAMNSSRKPFSAPKEIPVRSETPDVASSGRQRKASPTVRSPGQVPCSI
jgi:DNA-binding NarL/FixJ family response regulator